MVEKGARVAVKPFRERGYELAFVKDPDGIWIELLGRSKKRKKPRPEGKTVRMRKASQES